MDCSCGMMNNQRSGNYNMSRRDCGCNRVSNRSGSDRNMMNNRSNCGCRMENRPGDCDCGRVYSMKDAVVGMAYVPWQDWNSVLDPDKGLQEGSIFPEMIYPFYGCIPKGFYFGGDKRGGRCV